MRGEPFVRRETGLFGRLRLKGRTVEEITAWLFVLPVVVATLIFEILPMIPNVIFSLHDWNAVTPMRWRGLDNYAKLLDDPDFLSSIQVTFTYVVLVVPLTMIAGFLLALLINQKIRGVTVFRAIFYLPVISSIVATAVVWQFLLTPEFGLINQTLYNVFGIDGPNYLIDAPWAMIVLVLFSIWIGMGFQMVLFLAGLQGIPAHLYEAATIDGANAWHKVRHVTIPMLTPTIFLLFIISTIAAFNVFALVMVLTETSGNYANTTIYNGTQAVVVYLYMQGLTLFKFGLASTVAVYMFIIVGLLTLFNWKVVQRWVHYAD
jgi:multiple sugar transport system permease protein